MESAFSVEQQFLNRATEITEANLQNEQFGVNELAEKLGISRATLHRKIKSNTKSSVSQFICQIRLKKALELLKQNSSTISEIAYSCGFNSVTYFTKCFHDHYGCSPGEAAKREISKNHNNENQQNQIQPKWSRKKILVGGIILVTFFAVLLVVFLMRPFNTKTKNLPKIIAVLPFINDSQDASTEAFINGVREGIINNLSKVQDLRVISRISAELYKNSKKSIKQIAKELGVVYIVEGSGQKYGDQIKLHVQLIDAKSDIHLWSQPYDREWEDIFSIQSEIATSVAHKIEAKITPEESEWINAKPTKSNVAYNKILSAEQLISIGQDESNQVLFQQAEIFIRDAIMIDSTYSEAYVKLAWALAGKGKINDSTLYLANRALHFDNKNFDAYYLKGWYLLWYVPGKIDEAEDAFKLTIKHNPSHSKGYDLMGDAMWMKADYAHLIEYKLRAMRLIKDPKIYDPTYFLSFQLFSLGFFNEGLRFTEEIIKNNNDSSFYYLGLEAENMNSGNYKAAYDYCLKSGRTDNLDDWWCRANILCRLRNFKGALSIVDSLDKNGGPNIKFFKNEGQIIPNYYVGYTYHKNGLKEKAAFHFNGVIKEQQKIIKENTGKARGYAYYIMVCTYSAMGDKAKAVEFMKKMLENKDEIPISPVTMLEFRNHPMCDAIQGTPEHTKILKIAEENFQPVKTKIEQQLQEFFN